MPWTKNFDVDEALERACEVFWTHGYEATSMRDLLEAMGIQKGSFYDTYGSKHEVFLSALNRYVDTRMPGFAALGEGRQPREALAAMMDAIYAECVGPIGHRGCMALNCALELAPHDPEAAKIVNASLKMHEKIVADWIRAGQASGDIRADLKPKQTAKAILALIMGMRIYTRVGSSKASIKALSEQALALLDA